MKLKQKSQYGGGGLTSKDGLWHLFSECSFFREEGLKSNHNLQKKGNENAFESMSALFHFPLGVPLQYCRQFINIYENIKLSEIENYTK